jgi:hypothetical protein
MTDKIRNGILVCLPHVPIDRGERNIVELRSGSFAPAIPVIRSAENGAGPANVNSCGCGGIDDISISPWFFGRCHLVEIGVEPAHRELELAHDLLDEVGFRPHHIRELTRTEAVVPLIAHGGSNAGVEEGDEVVPFPLLSLEPGIADGIQRLDRETPAPHPVSHLDQN